MELKEAKPSFESLKTRQRNERSIYPSGKKQRYLSSRL